MSASVSVATRSLGGGQGLGTKVGKDLSPPPEGLESTYGVAFSHFQTRSIFLWENWSSAYNHNNDKKA